MSCKFWVGAQGARPRDATRLREAGAGGPAGRHAAARDLPGAPGPGPGQRLEGPEAEPARPVREPRIRNF